MNQFYFPILSVFLKISVFSHLCIVSMNRGLLTFFARYMTSSNTEWNGPGIRKEKGKKRKRKENVKEVGRW